MDTCTYIRVQVATCIYYTWPNGHLYFIHASIWPSVFYTRGHLDTCNKWPIVFHVKIATCHEDTWLFGRVATVTATIDTRQITRIFVVLVHSFIFWHHSSSTIFLQVREGWVPRRLSNGSYLFCLILILSCYRICFFKAGNTLSAGQSLSFTKNEIILSQGGTFELGFFTLGSSVKTYLGIWHKCFVPKEAIWVANCKSYFA